MAVIIIPPRTTTFMIQTRQCLSATDNDINVVVWILWDVPRRCAVSTRVITNRNEWNQWLLVVSLFVCASFRYINYTIIIIIAVLVLVVLPYCRKKKNTQHRLVGWLSVFWIVGIIIISIVIANSMGQTEYGVIQLLTKWKQNRKNIYNEIKHSLFFFFCIAPQFHSPSIALYNSLALPLGYQFVCRSILQCSFNENRMKPKFC